MSKADEMFEKLEYEKQVNKDDSERFSTYIKYSKDGSYGSTISFDHWNKRICADTFDEDYEWNEAYYFTMQELQAINLKCRELGWIEEKINKKDYKGYELIKAIHDGEIKDGTIIEIHDLSTLDHIKARIDYSNKRLNWLAGEFDTRCLFDDNIYFRVLEDNTEEIEELPDYNYSIKENRDKINELVRVVKQIRKEIKND